MRIADVTRVTKETDIKIEINLDGKGECGINTGVGFFDHMLTSFATHSGFDLIVNVKGDLSVDAHHTIEDTGIVLGQAFAKALSSKEGINRYGSFYVPMDEALGFCALDISSRPYLVYECDFIGDMMGDMDTQMVEEFFRAFAFNAGITLHVKALYGRNDHHKCEAMFKAVAHALSQAVAPNGKSNVLSSKGVI